MSIAKTPLALATSVRVFNQPLRLDSLRRDDFALVASAGELDCAELAPVVLLGDLHGNVHAAEALVLRIQAVFGQPVTSVIQVGDFGFWPKGESSRLTDPFYKDDDALDFLEIQNRDHILSIGDRPVDKRTADFFFIRGNHEDFSELRNEIASGLQALGAGFFHVPDGFRGHIAGIEVAAVGGILRDTNRGRGKRAKERRRAAIKALAIDERFADSALLDSIVGGAEVLLTHSGPASREHRHGSAILDDVLQGADLALHFYGHHHRFSVGKIGSTWSVGLRNLATKEGRLCPGAVALVFWKSARQFRVLVHESSATVVDESTFGASTFDSSCESPA